MTGGRVVVLGHTGRNFAAGMSGGVAFVYDADSTLATNLNAEMVELENIDVEDADWLQQIISTHVEATDSAVGQRVLADWDTEQRKFVKVMPRDYKRVMTAIAEAQASGLTDTELNDVIMAAARG